MIPNSPQAWTERAESAQLSHEACLWSEAGQRERHEAVLAALDPQPGESLLDYGCGTGALADLVPAGVDYVGVDWSAGMRRRARAEHPGLRFWSTTGLVGRVDLIAVIGTFNLADNWTKGGPVAALARLRRAHRPRALAVSLYAGDDPNCLHYDESDLEVFGPRIEWSRPRPNDLLAVIR